MNKQKTFILIFILIFIVIIGVVVVFRQSQSDESQEQALPSPTLAPQAMQSTIFKVAKNPTIGSYFTDAKGMTLYTFTKDMPGMSNCIGDCLTTWPPYTAQSQQTELPAKFGVIKRTDGILQYTWNNMPLYYYSGDTQPGQINGNGYKSLWSVAK